MKGFKYLLIFIFGFVFCYFLIVYNLKIKTAEKTEKGELLTILFFGNCWNYYNEY